MAKLIAFLGNPGNQYSKTRHNAGQMLCDYIFPDISWQSRFHGFFSRQGQAVLLKPQTFMNESGLSVQECAAFFSIPVQDILVVHDDIETDFAQVKFRRGGGLGGHNGLRSIKQHLGSDDFFRLKIGIGRPEREPVASWVLSGFSAEEISRLNNTFLLCRDIIEKYRESNTGE
ncbi:MAG: aminoacyl-tRNA hydrolase [Sphaerochaetaceae bacterium]|nr:aminoacyl-tRNA hydrolase [Sphaerochaetaceae bacterium]